MTKNCCCRNSTTSISDFDSLLLSLFDSLAGLSFSAAFLYDSLR